MTSNPSSSSSAREPVPRPSLDASFALVFVRAADDNFSLALHPRPDVHPLSTTSTTSRARARVLPRAFLPLCPPIARARPALARLPPPPRHPFFDVRATVLARGFPRLPDVPAPSFAMFITNESSSDMTTTRARGAPSDDRFDSSRFLATSRVRAAENSMESNRVVVAFERRQTRAKGE